VSESGDRVVRVMPSRVEPIPAAPLGGERPRHYTQIGISRRDPNLRRRPDRQDPRPAALLALPQGPRLASVLASVARARERDKRADSPRSVTEPGKHTALMQAPAYRGMKMILGGLLSGCGLTVGRPGQGPSGRTQSGRPLWTMRFERGLVSLAAPATCPGCAASTYRSLSFARWFSPVIDARRLP
jgi:hypothetical protein